MLLYIIMHALFPHLKTGDVKTSILQKEVSDISSTVRDGLIASSSWPEFKAKLLTDRKEIGGNRSPQGYIKPTFEGYDETFIKNILERLRDNTGGKENKFLRESFPMLAEEKRIVNNIDNNQIVPLNKVEDYAKNNLQIVELNKNLRSGGSNFSNLSNKYSLEKTDSGLNGFNSFGVLSLPYPKIIEKIPNYQNYDQTTSKIDFEEDKLFKNPSPNPFFEDFNMSQSNIFNSPIQTDNYSNNLYKIPHDNREENNHNNMLGLTLPVSRKNSLDISELYKNGNIETDSIRPVQDNNYPFDDSYFSVSSNNKTENKSTK